MFFFIWETQFSMIIAEQDTKFYLMKWEIVFIMIVGE